jgi:Flp pilus assembly secretin CpaC
MRKLLFVLLLGISSFCLAALDQVTVYVGQSAIVNFPENIKRVSIANTDVADASVTSASQMVINGKIVGVTSLVVWNDQEQVSHYKVVVQKERSPYQIMLQVRFLEVNKNNLKEFGVDGLRNGLKVGSESVSLGSFGGKVNQPNDPLLLGETVDFFLNIPTQNLSMIIKALEEKNLLSVLARPNLTTTDGTEANFLAGGKFPVPIVSGAAGMQTITIQFEEYGIKLRFTPTVLDSQLINLKVAAEVSSLDFDNGIILSGFRIPNINTRRAESMAELKQGQYLIMGGLLSNEIAKTLSRIPVIGAIPVLGTLFSSRRYTKKESELLIMVAPSIVQGRSVEEKTFNRTLQP